MPLNAFVNPDGWCWPRFYLVRRRARCVVEQHCNQCDFQLLDVGSVGQSWNVLWRHKGGSGLPTSGTRWKLSEGVFPAVNIGFFSTREVLSASRDHVLTRSALCREPMAVGETSTRPCSN
jgi:hypothetical protein